MILHRLLFAAGISTAAARALPTRPAAFVPLLRHHHSRSHNDNRNNNNRPDAPRRSGSAVALARRGGGGSEEYTAAAATAAADASTDQSSSSDHLLESLLSEARTLLDDGDADGAFDALARAFGVDPTSPRVSAMFESCLGLRVELAGGRYRRWREEEEETEDDDDPSSAAARSSSSSSRERLSEGELNDLFQDRMGLSSLFIDRELYDEAAVQLRRAIGEATFWLNRSLQRQSSSMLLSSSSSDFTSTPFEHWQPRIDRALYLLYRTDAAGCSWDSYFEDGDRLRRSLTGGHRRGLSSAEARLLHPFDALKFPCISLELASDIARSYASRALESVGANNVAEEVKYPEESNDAPPPRRETVTASRHDPIIRHERKIRIGYISPDLTSRHPLAFLMQHVFRCHDRSRFAVNVYSVSSAARDDDDGPEVRAIRESSDEFTYLSPSSSSSPVDMYERMMRDELDILVDLCGYAGTSVVSEIMASRCRLRQRHDDEWREGRGRRRHFPIHVSYMGFPGSVGSKAVWDYSVFDPIVVPPEEEHGIRRHYDEALVYMPHCYFVNSHKSVVGGGGDAIMVSNEDERKSLRAKYGIPPSAFVYCCHSRPDKIDPSTFRSWMRALSRVDAMASEHGRDGHLTTMATNGTGEMEPQSAVLWLLRSGDEMERNLRRLAREEFGEDAEGRLMFANVANRREHLRRLGIADVFLDTPAYNAHTLGCDALYAGVPMISLLREFEQTNDNRVVSSKSRARSADEHQDVNDADCGKETRSIATNKLASRVGASLLRAVGLDDLVYADMTRYEDAMVRCALDEEWFGAIVERLVSNRDTSPLFDTKRWVSNLEAAFGKMVELDSTGSNYYPDILVKDTS